MSVAVPNAMSFHLTPSALRTLGCDPIVAGDYRQLRLQYRRLTPTSSPTSGEAVPLTSGQIIFTVRRVDSTDDGDILFQRDSAQAIAGWTDDAFQIVFDVDQTVETGDTGRGWYAIIFTPPDEAALAAIANVKYRYDVRFMPADGHEKTLVRGDIEIVLYRTPTGDFA